MAADDTKGLEAGGTSPIPAAGEPVPEPTPAAATDWTASDARGPLNEAPPVPHATSREEVPGDSPVAQPPTEEASARAPRRSLVPVAAAVIVGAVIGAGSAYFVYDYALQHATNDGVDQKMAALSERVATLDKRPDPQPAIAALKTSVAALEGKVAALQKAASVAPASAPTPAPPVPASPAATTAPATVASTPAPSSTGSAPSATKPAAVASTAAPSSTPPSPAASATPTSAPPAFDPAPLQQKIAALQATIDGLQKQAAETKALEAKVGTIQTTVDGLKTQTADVQKQTSEVQKQTTEVQKQTSEVQKQTTEVQKQASEIQKQASGTQAGIEAIQGQQKSFEGRISAPALAVVADSLVQQIEQGQPYGAQVDALATLGADPARIAILRENARKGVPSAKALAAQFKPLAEPILATAHKVAPDAGLFDRLKSGMSGMVSLRSTSDTAGDGLDARVSRIEADLTHDDITGAYNTWTSLPADAKAKSDAWGALAKTATEAIDAAHALQQGAISSLGGRKS